MQGSKPLVRLFFPPDLLALAALRWFPQRARALAERVLHLVAAVSRRSSLTLELQLTLRGAKKSESPHKGEVSKTSFFFECLPFVFPDFFSEIKSCQKINVVPKIQGA